MIERLIAHKPWVYYLVQAIVILITGIGFGITLNFFYIPANIYSGGVAGAAQIIVEFINRYTPFKGAISTGTLYFLLNIPLIVLGLFKLGRQFTVLTLIVVAVSSIATNLIPVVQVSSEPLLNAVVGGVIAGVGGGLSVKYGMSTGGIDILSMVIMRATGMNVGSLNLIMNSFIIVGAGFMYSWEYALFTLIAMAVTSYVVDMIHTNEQRLTAFIVTDEEEAVIQSIYQRIMRGITILDGKGGYTGDKRSVLMVVITRYELFDLQMAVVEVDEDAFINIIQSTKVQGNFLKRHQQTEIRS